MATISNMTSNTYTMYKMASDASTQKPDDGGSKKINANEETASATATAIADSKKKHQSALDQTKTRVAQLSAVVNSFSSASTGNKSKAGSLTSSIWKSQNTAASDLQTLNSISAGIAGLKSSYTNAKNRFYTEFDANIGDLKNSSAAVKSMNFNFSASDIKSSADGKTQTYSTGLKSAISKVQQLVKDYNNASDLFASSSGISDRIKNMATTFGDTSYRANIYDQIGVKVDEKTGALSVDESKLAKALTENPDRVKNALGSNGLAGKAENHANLASSQRSRLFPSMQNLIGGEIEAASIYNAKTLINTTKYTTAGSLLNLNF